MNTLSDEELVEAYQNELKKLDSQAVTIDLSLMPIDAVCLIGAVQLACRHPEFIGPSRTIVEDLVEQLRLKFLQHDVPHIVEVIDRGSGKERTAAAAGAKTKAGYKLPICWLGKSRTRYDEQGKMYGEIVTEADIDPECHCENEMQAFFCAMGHLTECHAGMTCEDAECSHYRRGDDLL